MQDDHPLLVNLMLNSDYVEHFNALLKDLDGIPNLSEKIEDMNCNREGWKGYCSELEFAKEIKKLNPEFIKKNKRKSIPTADLKATLLGKDIFFEVKLLDDVYYKDGKFIVEVAETKLDLTTKITYSKLSKEQRDKLIERRNTAINANKEDSFSIGDAEIRIQRNPPLNFNAIEFHNFDLNYMRKRILQEFRDKIKQLQPYSPIFLVIDCHRPDYNKNNFTNFIYGNNDGIFIYPETNCLNGIVARLHSKSYFFLNPNAKTKISSRMEREMEKWFEYNS